MPRPSCALGRAWQGPLLKEYNFSILSDTTLQVSSGTLFVISLLNSQTSVHQYVMDVEADQPDFEQLQQGLTLATTQLAKLRNMPVFNMAARLDTMQQNMEARLDAVQQNMAAVQQNMATMQQNMATMLQNMNRNHEQLVEVFLRSELNNIARVRNAKVSDALTQLEPLRDLHNNPIQGFPRTPRGITQMNEEQMNQLLNALGLAMEGTLMEKQDRFRHYIGLSILA
ncbi:hypothetical protein L211DRAFT_56358 [Terfezia boudieri ATCC MYA-4762]|uniref:Uncharacterized protein n=1 Tax=Terfezia boudieri ATCC MYA-4762 TaxID=1051890 RepID=A0A3N4LSC6_9PEZI|nr:hypothetical protein L211DRAFT_56358 [Terfezia boudieri ATCC MYA-4762]